ncbi:hypothetical protein NOVOSPHI9U_50228 [Novosphingobium sp. 9U]|nr:hypothetical protein NOVOSPHI9U_50228 [Novosphingobium sp. 9U]
MLAAKATWRNALSACLLLTFDSVAARWIVGYRFSGAMRLWHDMRRRFTENA